MVRILSNHIKSVVILFIMGLIIVGGAAPVHAAVILDFPQTHYVSGGVTATKTLDDVYLVANYVSETPNIFEQKAFLIADSIPANTETTFEFIIPDVVDYSATRYYTVMANYALYDDINLGFDSAVAANLNANQTSWASYFNESFQPTEASVATWLETANTTELGGFLGDNSGLSPHKLGVGIDTYGDTVYYELVDFCSANDGGDTWVREGRIPEPLTLLLLTPGMLLVARRKRHHK